MQSATCTGVRLRLTPSDSSTSALPDCDDTERPPCLATRAPAAAVTNAAVVEILNVCALSPPVPQVSTRLVKSATSTLVENSRITCAAAAISDTDSDFTCKPIRIADNCTGVTFPSITWRNRSTISSKNISRLSERRLIASCGVNIIAPSYSGNFSRAHGRARS